MLFDGWLGVMFGINVDGQLIYMFVFVGQVVLVLLVLGFEFECNVQFVCGFVVIGVDCMIGEDCYMLFVGKVLWVVECYVQVIVYFVEFGVGGCWFDIVFCVYDIGFVFCYWVLL